MAEAARRIPVVLPWRKMRQVGSRLGWGVADQAMCSLTNFLLSVYIARSLGAAEFGAFSLAYVTYGFAINASRGLSIEPLLIRYSGTAPKIWRRAAAGCSGTALLVGLATGTLALLAGVLIGGTIGMAFLALGLTMPGLLLQDSWRYAFFANGKGLYAFVNDGLWAAVQIPLLVIVKMTGHANVFWFVMAWGAGAAVGAVFGCFQAKVAPRLVGATVWLMLHRDLGPRYLVENTGGNASDTLRSYGTSSLLGLTAVGDIQAAGVLMGPFKIILFGLGMITIPEASQIRRRSPRQLPVFCVVVSLGLTVLAAAWGAVLLVALPFGLGHLMLGGIWRAAYPLVLPTALAIVAGCATTGANVGLHALGAAKRSLRSTIITSVISVTFALVGAVVAGVLGTLYFAAVGSWLGTLISWYQFRQALHDSSNVPVPSWMWPPRSGGDHGSPVASSQPRRAGPELEARPSRR